MVHCLQTVHSFARSYMPKKKKSLSSSCLIKMSVDFSGGEKWVMKAQRLLHASIQARGRCLLLKTANPNVLTMRYF